MDENSLVINLLGYSYVLYNLYQLFRGKSQIFQHFRLEVDLSKVIIVKKIKQNTHVYIVI